jgi:hypothetical protein
MYKITQIPIKAQMERMYTHGGSGFAGIFAGVCGAGGGLA